MEGQNTTPEKAWPTWAAAFLKALAITGNVSRAANAAKVHRRTAYDLRNADESFALSWQEAKDEASDLLEEEAHRRAYEGVSRPILHQGKPVFVWMKGKTIVPKGTKGAKKVALMEHDYSDTLLIFLLNGERPEKFKKRMEHTGAGGSSLVPPVVLYLPDNGRKDGADAATDNE